MTSERRAQVKEIYEETLAKQASERLSFLRERCAADEDLQAEVLHMLVESATAQAPASDATATITDIPGGSFALGELVCDRFRILRLLGRGGMGEVYEAEDLELHGHVALKTIRPDRAFNDSMQSRFRQEVHLARRVTHRNVCRIFDVYRHASTSKDGAKQDVLFVTMEFLEGDTLGNHLRVHGPFTGSDALPLAQQIAEGLSAAHSAGVVHRDFKPGNVMLVRTQSGASRAVVTDFGIAQSMLASNAGADVDTVTRAGVIVGTPAYMAPEQLKGQPATPASDVYALGLVLREMLSREGSAARPVPPPFDAVIQRCLQHDPMKRYQSASEVVAALQAPHGRPSRVSWKLAAVALCVILMVAGLSLRRPIAAWVAGVPGEKHLAVLPFHNIGGDPSNQLFCDGVVETVTSKLAQLERFQKSFWVVPSSEVRKVKDLADAERTLGVTLVVSGSMQRMGGVVRLIANLNDAHGRKMLASRTIDARIEDLPALEDRVWQQVADMLDLQIAPETKKVLSEGETQIAGAYEYYQQGRGYSVRFGLESIDRAIGLYKQALERDPQYALAYSGLAEAYAKKFDLTKDVNMIDAARQNSDRALAMNDKLSPVLLTAARVAFVSGNREQAIQFWKRTLDMDPASAEAMMWLGRAYDDLGKFTEAESAYNNAIALRPGYWAGYSAIAYFYKVHGQYSRAEGMYKRAAALAPDNPANYENLGGVYVLMGRYDDAIATLTRSIAIKETAPALSNLATAYMFQKQYDKAIPLLQKAVQLLPKYDTLWGNLGEAYAMAGRPEDLSASAYRQALELAEAQLRVNPNNASALAQAAKYSAKLHDNTKARSLIARAVAASPGDADLLFRSGLIYEWTGDRTKAIDAVQAAWKRGYSLDRIRTEPELETLRQDPRFQAWFQTSSR